MRHSKPPISPREDKAQIQVPEYWCYCLLGLQIVIILIIIQLILHQLINQLTVGSIRHQNLLKDLRCAEQITQISLRNQNHVLLNYRK